MYNEYTEEDADPSKDNRYALFARVLGMSGKIASIATSRTHVWIENRIVCLSIGIEFAFVLPFAEDGAALLMLGPEFRGFCCSCAGGEEELADVLDDWEEFDVDIGSTTSSGSM